MVVDNKETFYVDDLAVATRKNYKEENHVDYSKQGGALKGDNKMAVKIRDGLKTKVELVKLAGE
jgi:hypothetical protein